MFGCVHRFRPTSERIVSGPKLRVSIDRVTFQALGASDAELELRVGAQAGVVLKKATLASLVGAPCDEGTPFIDVYRDGVVVLHPPLELGGSHRLRLVFSGREAADGVLRTGSALDLEVESSTGVDCYRVPLGKDTPELAWQLEPPDAGVLASVGARAFPVRTSNVHGFEPLWTANVREGAVLGENRVWVEVQAGTDRSGDDTLVMVGLGGNRVLTSSGSWAFATGVGYDLGASTPPGRNTPARYGLRGPRVTPSLLYALPSLSPHFPGFPAGQHRPHVELEVPLFGWFGVNAHADVHDAPKFVVVPAIGLNLEFTL
ncbi:MAG TPA: hypothetical protein VGI10_15280 [Polyangiaceae bacterium]|jgi:hypothetical protein